MYKRVFAFVQMCVPVCMYVYMHVCVHVRASWFIVVVATVEY